MKKITVLILFSFFFGIIAKSQIKHFYKPRIWTTGTALTVDKGIINLNLLEKSQIGITDHFELQSQIAKDFFYPNLSLKINWFYKKPGYSKKLFQKSGYAITTKHYFAYPPMILNKFFGFSANPFLHTYNQLIISMIIPKNTGCYKKKAVISLKAGYKKSIGNNANYIVSDNSLAYILSGGWDSSGLMMMGLQYDNSTSYQLFYKLKLNWYRKGLKNSVNLLENSGFGYFYAGQRKRLRLGLGYEVVFAINGGIKPSFAPMLDVSFIIKPHKKNLSKDLFDKDMKQNAIRNPDIIDDTND